MHSEASPAAGTGVTEEVHHGLRGCVPLGLTESGSDAEHLAGGAVSTGRRVLCLASRSDLVPVTRRRDSSCESLPEAATWETCLFGVHL